MLDIGWSEMLVIAVVLIVVVGPRDLPAVLRSFGKYAAQLRRMAGDFQSQFNDALREAELDDVRKDIESLRKANPANQIKSMVSDAIDPVRDAGRSVETATTKALSDQTPLASNTKAGGTEKTASKPAAKAPRKPAAKKTAAKKPARKTRSSAAAKKKADTKT